MASALLQAHVPIFYFDKDERFRPANLSQYVLANRRVYDKTVTGIVSPTTDSRGRNVTDLWYFTFYFEDGGLEFGDTGLSVGGHQFDVESVVVRIDNQTQAVTTVAYLPHGSREHFRIAGSADLSRILVNGRPRVYVSRGKHGQYPVPGTIGRPPVIDSCDPGPADASFTVTEAIKTVKGASIPPSNVALPPDAERMASIGRRKEKNIEDLDVVRLDDVTTHLVTTSNTAAAITSFVSSIKLGALRRWF